MGALRLFCFLDANSVLFCFRSVIMRNKARFLVQAAVIAALYAALSHLQNALWPAGTTMAVQFRVSEALCVLALFTPSAIPGLTLGCFLFNLTSGAALPLDFLVGSLASLLAAGAMWLTRNKTLKGIPLFALLMPGLLNGLLVGWELTFYIGGGFWFNAGSVALGETVVLLTLGTALYAAIKVRRLDQILFA